MKIFDKKSFELAQDFAKEAISVGGERGEADWAFGMLCLELAYGYAPISTYERTAEAREKYAGIER